MEEIKIKDIEDMISELNNLSQYAKILENPEEFFHHMQGHRTELSLVLSTFRIAELSSNIIKLLKEQLSSTVDYEYYYECQGCGKPMNDKIKDGDMVNGYCWDCLDKIANVYGFGQGLTGRPEQRRD